MHRSKGVIFFYEMHARAIMSFLGGDDMQSKLLRENGLLNKIGGSDYNFRSATAKDSIKADVERLLAEAEMTDALTVYTGKQIHGKNVAYADGEMGDKFVIGRHFTETDGLITDKPGVALLIKYSDCTPVVLFDPVKNVQASVHSGWRSTVLKISHVAIDKMVKEFGCQKENILAYLGPSIDQENYEVGPEVYEAFDGEVDRDLYFRPHGEKYLLSMTDANYQLLLKAGIQPENIEVNTASTFTDEALHSARKEGKDYELNGIITMLPYPN